MQQKIQDLMLKRKYFPIEEDYFEIFPPAHPLILKEGVDIDLANNCIDETVELVSFEGRGDLEIDKLGPVFGHGQSLRYDRGRGWVTELKLPQFIQNEYGLKSDKNGFIDYFEAVWFPHNLDTSARIFGNYFAIAYGNAIVKKKYGTNKF